MTAQIHRFVKRSELDRWLRLGWTVRSQRTEKREPVMIAWLCDCFPQTPLVNRYYREATDAAARSA